MHKYYQEAKEFGDKYLTPFEKEVDIKGCFPRESIQALRDHGYFGLVISKEYGGQGKGIVEHTEVCTGLAEAGASVSLCYMMSNVGAYCLSLYGSEALKKEILPQVASGEKILGLAYSETDNGTHFYLPTMEETPKEGYSILNGRKSFVTTAREADYYLTSSRSTEDGTINLWMVPGNAKGLSFESTYDGFGLRGNVSDPMILDNVKVDHFYKIKGNGDGDRLIFILGLASSSAGISMAIAKEATKYVKNRTYETGKSLGEIESVEVNISDLYSRAYSARETLFAAAKAINSGDIDGFEQVIAARINATKAAVKNGTDGMKLFGGIGYVRHVEPMEKLMRDSLGAQVMAPGIDVLKIWLGRLLVDLPYLKEI